MRKEEGSVELRPGDSVAAIVALLFDYKPFSLRPERLTIKQRPPTRVLTEIRELLEASETGEFIDAGDESTINYLRMIGHEVLGELAARAALEGDGSRRAAAAEALFQLLDHWVGQYWILLSYPQPDLKGLAQRATSIPGPTSVNRELMQRVSERLIAIGQGEKSQLKLKGDQGGRKAESPSAPQNVLAAALIRYIEGYRSQADDPYWAMLANEEAYGPFHHLVARMVRLPPMSSGSANAWWKLAKSVLADALEGKGTEHEMFSQAELLPLRSRSEKDFWDSLRIAFKRMCAKETGWQAT